MLRDDVTEQSWSLQGACYGLDQTIFYGNADGKHPKKIVNKAKGYCKTCPVANICLYQAVKNNEQFGVWGGLTPRERNLMPHYFGKDFTISIATEIVELYGNTAVSTKSN